ncbi:MAG: prepilin-type N-terminal cleavage/methylation domain-containing protein [Candidatus Krumholzibacteria bacterium]|nr:prepilin-type N-terminal cleavage/methylation domain-containing protein [Candidatus Krumholzibacteria bacterium]
MNSQKGFGLIEILIAMVLFGIGISLAMRTLPESNVATTRGRNITKATNLAQQKIEELLSVPYSDADLNAGTHNDPENPIDLSFTRSWVVADNVPVNGMKQIDVTVIWETASKDSTVTLQTYLTSRR